MHNRHLILIAASLALSAPALAQDAPPPPSSQNTAPAAATTPAAPPASNPVESTTPPANADLPEITVSSPEPETPPAEPAEKATPKVTADAPADLPKPKQAKTPRSKKQPKPAPQTATVAPAAAPQSAPNPEPIVDDLPATPGIRVVSATSFATVRETTAADIAATHGATITDTLASKPGVSGSTFAPGASRPILRGLDNTRVRIQENGIGSHDVSTLSEDHSVPIDPVAADRVEVIHGPETLRYGGQAIGGVVSVENGRIPTAIPPNGISAVVKGGGATTDDSSDGAISVTAGSSGFAIHADTFARRAEDYDTPRGIVANSFAESDGGAVGLSRVWETGFAGVALVRTESTYGIPAEDAHIEMTQDKILARSEWRVGGDGIEALRFWAGASDYAHSEVTGEGDVGSHFTNTEEELRAELSHQPLSTAFGPLRGTAGLHAGHRNVRGESFEGDSILEPARTTAYGGFLFEELALTNRLRLQAAARIDQVDVDGFGIQDPLGTPAPARMSRTFTPQSASLGAALDLTANVKARISGKYVERAPDAAELFSKGLHEATGTFEIGNPDLTKEKATTAEVGLSRTAGALRFDASAYYTRFDGFIFKQLTGVACGETLASCGTDDELDQLVFGQSDATVYGTELSAELDVASLWRGVWGIDAAYDYVRGTHDSGDNVQRIPPQRLGAGLYYRDANWRARAGLLHVFAQTDIGLNETETGSHNLVSAEISYTEKASSLGALTPEVTIGLKGENLLDDDVRNHASFNKDEVLQPGASLRLFGTLAFD